MVQKIVKARKEHSCLECFKPIEKGEKYEYSTERNDDDDGWFQMHLCLRCAALKQKHGMFYEPQRLGEICEEVRIDADKEIARMCRDNTTR